MISFLFLTFAYSSKIFDITDSNSHQYLGKASIMVKFYAAHQKASYEIKSEFIKLAAYYRNLSFGQINCETNKNTCGKENITELPTMRLYLPDSFQDFYQYEGDIKADDMSDFIEDYFYENANRTNTPLKILNPLTYYKTIRNSSCSFIFFYEPPDHKAFLARELAKTFQFEENVTIGSVDCSLHTSLCKRNSKNQIILMKDNIQYPYKEEPIIKDITSFINYYCDTDRNPNGFLSDDYGTINDGNVYAQRFIRATKREKQESILAQCKTVEGAEFYVKVMERILDTGMDKFLKYYDTMKLHISQRKGTGKEIDDLKIKLNIMTYFLPEDYRGSTLEEL